MLGKPLSAVLLSGTPDPLELGPSHPLDWAGDCPWGLSQLLCHGDVAQVLSGELSAGHRCGQQPMVQSEMCLCTSAPSNSPEGNGNVAASVSAFTPE